MEQFSSLFRGINMGAFVNADDVIEKGEKPSKGGEGSKGGHVIGHTTSGKPIYAKGAAHGVHAGFTAADHKDAADHLDGYAKSVSESKTLGDEAKKKATETYAAAAKEHRALSDAKKGPDRVAAAKTKGADSDLGKGMHYRDMNAKELRATAARHNIDHTGMGVAKLRQAVGDAIMKKNMDSIHVDNSSTSKKKDK